MADTNELKIISDEEITALTSKLVKARDILYAFAAFEAWPSNIRSISPEEAKKLDEFPTRIKIDSLTRVACQVERALEHLRGKQVERKKAEPVEEGCDHGMILIPGYKPGTFEIGHFKA